MTAQSLTRWPHEVGTLGGFLGLFFFEPCLAATFGAIFGEIPLPAFPDLYKIAAHQRIEDSQRCLAEVGKAVFVRIGGNINDTNIIYN